MRGNRSCGERFPPQLKDAQAKKDSDSVKKLAVESSKLARAEAAVPQPADAAAVADWKQRVDFAKQVDQFAEYSLASTAIADPANLQDLVETLLTMNPKSQYLGNCAHVYLDALAKDRPKGKLDGAKAAVEYRSRFTRSNWRRRVLEYS